MKFYFVFTAGFLLLFLSQYQPTRVELIHPDAFGFFGLCIMIGSFLENTKKE